VIRLEAARVSGRFVTSEAAIRRFIEAQQSHETETRPPPSDDRHEAVEKELADLGIR
jgi:hypothetical protein